MSKKSIITLKKLIYLIFMLAFFWIPEKKVLKKILGVKKF